MLSKVFRGVSNYNKMLTQVSVSAWIEIQGSPGIAGTRLTTAEWDAVQVAPVQSCTITEQFWPQGSCCWWVLLLYHADTPGFWKAVQGSPAWLSCKGESASLSPARTPVHSPGHARSLYQEAHMNQKMKNTKEWCSNGSQPMQEQSNCEKKTV